MRQYSLLENPKRTEACWPEKKTLRKDMKKLIMVRSPNDTNRHPYLFGGKVSTQT